MTTARVAATRVLVAVERGRTTLAAEIERTRDQIADRRDRGLLLEIASGTLRWRSEVDAWLEACSRRPLHDLAPEVRASLRIAAYQLLHLERVPAHAIVHEAVEGVRALGHVRAAGFVNAVLRGLLRRRAQSPLPARPESATDTAAARAYLSVTLSHPLWLIDRWLARHGFEPTEAWCRFNDAPPDVTLRLLGDLSADECVGECRAADIEAVQARFVPAAVRLTAGGLSRLPPAVAARVAVQDEASQLVAYVTGAVPGDRVLDVCAAPGGKTAILASAVRPDGLVVAGDRRSARIEVLRETLRRAGQHALVAAFDTERALPFSAAFDRVLLDAPCSGLGTLRRDPDLKWSRRETDLPRFAAVQRRMLEEAARTVRPGGSLVYSTCSSEPEENDEVVAAFLGAHPEFRLGPLSGGSSSHDARPLLDSNGFLRTLPFRDGLDAFFAARLVRRQNA